MKISFSEPPACCNWNAKKSFVKLILCFHWLEYSSFSPALIQASLAIKAWLIQHRNIHIYFFLILKIMFFGCCTWFCVSSCFVQKRGRTKFKLSCAMEQQVISVLSSGSDAGCPGGGTSCSSMHTSSSQGSNLSHQNSHFCSGWFAAASLSLSQGNISLQMCGG